MKVNVNSWHYKLYAFTFNKPVKSYGTYADRPKSLCTYFWSVVIAILYSPIVLIFNYVFGTVSAFAFECIEATTPISMGGVYAGDRSDRRVSAWYMIGLIVLLGGIFSLINMQVLGYKYHIAEYLEMIVNYPWSSISIGMALFFATIVIFCAIAIGMIIGVIYFFIESTTFNKIVHFFTSNMFIEYLRAVKNKACPIIEYSDMKKDSDS